MTITKEYAGFIRGMWQENCIEREALTNHNFPTSNTQKIIVVFWRRNFILTLRQTGSGTKRFTTIVMPSKNNFCMPASCFYFFKGLFSTEVSKNLPFTDLKKCDKIYLN